MKPKIKVVILDGNRIFRLGLKKILADEEIDIVGEAADGAVGTNIIRQQKPDVVLLSSELPETNEIGFCEWIHRHFQETKVLFLLKNADIPTLSRLLKTSAKGFLTKDSTHLNSEMIKTIAEGKTYLQPDLALEVLQHPPHATDVLSHREYQVLILIAQNCTHEAIAEKLCISIKTVFNVKYRGFKKLEIQAIEELQRLLQN